MWWMLSVVFASPVQVAHTVHVTDADGLNAAGPVDVQVSLWLTESGGAVPEWSETLTVPADAGPVSLVLGAEGDLDSSVFAGDVFVQTTIGAVQSPRSLLAGAVRSATARSIPQVQRWIRLQDGVRRWSDGTVAASCDAYRHPVGPDAYLGDTGTGTYRIDPGTGAFDVVCDMTTDGGGWALVWSNVGGRLLATASNQALIASPADALVMDPSIERRSAMHADAFAAYWSAPNKTWMKRTVLYDPADAVAHELVTVLDMGTVTMNEVFSTPFVSGPAQCTQLSDTIETYVNGHYTGSTQQLLQRSALTFGLASDVTTDDQCGQSEARYLSSVAPVRLNFLGGGTDEEEWTYGFNWRDVFSYIHTDSGKNGSRCAHACWDTNNYGGYGEAFVWGVR